MTEANALVIDGFSRVQEIARDAVRDLNVEDLMYQPGDRGNSIAWLIWHLTRIQDNHVADLAGSAEVWSRGWSKKFGLPFPDEATGWGHSPADVAAVRADAKLLIGYYDAVHDVTVKYVSGLTADDYARVVDTEWDPPVTCAVRIVSVLSDDLQHAGQAAYVKGLLDRG